MAFFSKNKTQVPASYKNDLKADTSGFIKPNRSKTSHVDDTCRYIASTTQIATTYGSHVFSSNNETVRGTACAASIKHTFDNDGVIIGYLIVSSENSSDDLNYFNNIAFTPKQIPNKARTEKIIQDLYKKNNLMSLTTTEVAYDEDGNLHCVTSNITGQNALIGEIDPINKVCYFTKINGKSDSEEFNVNEVKLENSDSYIIHVSNEVTRNIPQLNFNGKNILPINQASLEISAAPLQLADTLMDVTRTAAWKDIMACPAQSMLVSVVKVPNFKLELVRALIEQDDEGKKLNILKRIVNLKKTHTDFSIKSTFQELKSELFISNQNCRRSEIKTNLMYAADKLELNSLIIRRAIKIDSALSEKTQNIHSVFKDLLLHQNPPNAKIILKLKDINILFNMFKEHTSLNAITTPKNSGKFFKSQDKHSQAWKNMLSEIRQEALNILVNDINNWVGFETKKSKLEILKEARKLDIFNEHKNEHWYEGAFCRTKAVAKIDKWIDQIKKDPYQVLVVSKDSSKHMHNNKINVPALKY